MEANQKQPSPAQEEGQTSAPPVEANPPSSPVEASQTSPPEAASQPSIATEQPVKVDVPPKKEESKAEPAQTRSSSNEPKSDDRSERGQTFQPSLVDDLKQLWEKLVKK